MKSKVKKNLLKIVRENYQSISDHFSKTREKFPKPELLRLAKEVESKSKVLDVGCGNGKLVKHLPENIEYLGLDTNENFIKIASEKYPNETIQFRFGDCLELNQEPEVNFDWVFCLAVLHHIPSFDLRVKALKQLRNKVNKEGKIVLTVWNLYKSKKYRKLIFKFWLLKLIGKSEMEKGDILFSWKNPKGEQVSQRYYHAFTKRELKKTCKKSKLKIEKIYKKDFNFYIILKRKS